MIRVKIMDLNTFIDVFSMLLRCLNLADGLHATHVALILKLPQFPICFNVKLNKNFEINLYLHKLLELMRNMFPIT